MSAPALTLSETHGIGQLLGSAVGAINYMEVRLGKVVISGSASLSCMQYLSARVFRGCYR